MTTATKTAPATVADWESYLGELDSPEKFTKAFNDGTFKAQLAGYVGASNKEREDITVQVKEQVQASMAEFLKANKETGSANRLNMDIGNTAGAKPSPALNNPKASGAPLNGVWDNFYEFLQCVWQGNKNPSAAQADQLKVLNEYSEKVPAEGGFLVPEEFRSEIMMLSLSDSIVRPRATVIPMASPRLHIPSVDETSRVSSVFGGIVVYRTEEGAELTESQASFGSVKLDVTKQTALAHVPNELVRDWGGFAAFIQATMPPAVGFFEDLDFLSGTGAGEPLGALNDGNGALIQVAKESGQAAATIVWENILRMYSRMLPSSMSRAVWVASPDTFAELATMALNVGSGGSAVWLVDGTGTPQLTLLGRPVLMTEKAPGVLGTAGDLNFVDFGMYLIGDYQTMTVDSSPHVKFTSDKTTFRVISRNDGRPWLQSAITPQNNSATLSPFIQLATRS